jgi:hypothetical protein
MRFQLTYNPHGSVSHVLSLRHLPSYWDLHFFTPLQSTSDPILKFITWQSHNFHAKYCLQLSIYPPRKNTRRQIKSSKTAATETNINWTFYQLIKHCGNSSLKVTRVSDHVGSQEMVKFITNRNTAALNAGNINMCSCFFENEIWCRKLLNPTQNPASFT